jgi:hypothetical protein
VLEFAVGCKGVLRSSSARGASYAARLRVQRVVDLRRYGYAGQDFVYGLTPCLTRELLGRLRMGGTGQMTLSIRASGYKPWARSLMIESPRGCTQVTSQQVEVRLQPAASA